MEIIRAEVIQDRPSIQLSTVNKGMGTVKAYCRRCRGVLIIKGESLYCTICDKKEARVISDNYGLEY